MNFKALESSQKLRGGFYTDPVIASFLTKWACTEKTESVLEPSCGDGVFLGTLAKQRIPSLRQVIACEIEPDEAEKARKHTFFPINVINCDFLRWFLFDAQMADRFDAVIGNPPFIRYQYLSAEQQFLSEKIFTQLGLPFTKHTNAWVPFVLASIRLLKPGGRIAMVIPSEILHIPHAAPLRRYMAAQCSRILIIDPQEILFGETLQGTVLLLAEKKSNDCEKNKGVSIISISKRQDLSINPEHQFQNAAYVNGTTIEGKWMSIFLSQRERELLTQLRDSTSIKRFYEIASVDVGIVTGANKFFLVPDKTVTEYALQKWAHPMFGRSDHVDGLIFTSLDYKTNRLAGLPSNFIWFQEENLDDLPSNALRYIKTGLSQQLQKRFKCRNRKCWYKVPSVYSAPMAMLKRAHNYPRLVLNKANAFTTDTAYRIRPIDIKPSALVLGFINSLTCLTAELEGRHYGGGVLELVPSEIERLLIPIIKGTNADLILADKRYRKQNNDLAYLGEQDSIVLGSIGLTKSEQITLYSAWLRLRDRRQRISHS